MALYINQNLYPGEFLLHKKYAATELLLDLLWTHSNIIADVALDLLDNHEFDKNDLPRELVIQAALLHEIGVYACTGFEWIPNQPPSTKPYIQHGIIGAWILQQEGYAAPVVQAAYCHIGVGLTAEDIRSHGLDMPEQDFLPQTSLQRFMTYASKFHSKTPKFRTSEQIKEQLRHFSNEKVAAFEELEQVYGVPNLEKIQQQYTSWHNSFAFRIQEIGKVSKTINLNPAGISSAPAEGL